eukprot:gene5488-3962_t
MSAAYLIVTRFGELLSAGSIDAAATYLDEDVILQSWQGVAEGKADVVSYLSDSRRFMHHTRTFTPWQHVTRTMELAALHHPGEAQSGYDGQGYAIFERIGTMSTRPRFSVKSESVRETIVVRNDYIVLIVLAKRGL